MLTSLFIGKNLSRSDINKLYLSIDDSLLPYQFDISIFTALKNTALIEHINRIGITIYEKQQV